MFNRERWITLLANDVYVALLVKDRFSRDARDSELAGNLDLAKEIAEVIFERLESFPLEEMQELWRQHKSKALVAAINQFEKVSTRLHLDADRLESRGVKQPWAKLGRLHARTKADLDTPKFARRQFKHRHQNAWRELRVALSEYRLALGDMDLTQGFTGDKLRDAILNDPEAVKKILDSQLEIGITRSEREAHLGSDPLC